MVGGLGPFVPGDKGKQMEACHTRGCQIPPGIIDTNSEGTNYAVVSQNWHQNVRENSIFSISEGTNLARNDARTKYPRTSIPSELATPGIPAFLPA